MRKRRPVDLTHVEPREIIRVSLETGDKRTAIARYPFKLAEIELHFEKLRADCRQKGRVEAAATVGRLDLPNMREIEELALDWWKGRERGRMPVVRDDNDLNDLIEEDAASLAHPPWGDPDVIASTTGQPLVLAGMVSKPRKVGSVQLQSRTLTLNRGSFTGITGNLRQGFCASTEPGFTAGDHSRGAPLRGPQPSGNV